MPEIGTSGSMSGDGKRSVGHRPQATAPILDSTYSDGIAALRHLWIILCRLAGALGHRAIRQTSVLRIGSLLNSQVNDFRAFGGREVPRKSG